MRKIRDFDSELKALEDKARQLKARKVQQLGELVIACGADVLTPDELAGALVAIAETRDAAKREAWAKRGQAFFSGRSHAGDGGKHRHRDDSQAAPSPPPAPMLRDGALPFDDSAQPVSGGASTL